MKELSFSKPNALDDAVIPKSGTRSKGSKVAPVLRTYSRDVESLVQEAGITKTQAVIAEEARRESRGERRTAVRDDDSHLTRIIFILLLVLAFIVGVGLYVLIGTTSSTPTGGVREGPRIERMYEVNIAGAPREQIFADITTAYSKISFDPKESRVVVFTVPDETGRAHDATAEEFLATIPTLPAPEMLRTALGKVAYLRIHGRTAADPLVGSLEFEVRSYPNAFAGMLEWEDELSVDIIPVLDPKFSRTTLATLERRAFVDERISGIDARTLRDPEGKSVLAYAFIGKDRLVIAGNVEILAAIISEASATK